MSKYYFFNSLAKVFEIGSWFYNELGDVAYLNNSSPVVFTIDDITYTIEYNEDNGKIFCTRLCGNKLIKSPHRAIIEKIEKFLDRLKDTK